MNNISKLRRCLTRIAAGLFVLANAEEERAPSWSMDGRRIVYCCRKGAPEREGGVPTFEICVMNADGTGQTG